MDNKNSNTDTIFMYSELRKVISTYRLPYGSLSIFKRILFMPGISVVVFPFREIYQNQITRSLNMYGKKNS